MGSEMCIRDRKESETSDSLDESSADESDREDLFFQVKAKMPDTQGLPCEEDVVRQRCVELRTYMRMRPCLPLKQDGTEMTSEDLSTGVQLPLYACPFKNCVYVSNDRVQFLHHVAGGVKDPRHRACIESICGTNLTWMTRLDYVNGAVAKAERERWPLLGLSTTRRALNTLCKRYNDKTVLCGACLICGQIRTTCEGYPPIALESNDVTQDRVSKEFAWHSLEWLRHLEKNCPGTLLNNCSYELWRRRYFSDPSNATCWTYTGPVQGKWSCCPTFDRERHISKWATCLPMDGHALMLFGCTEDIFCHDENNHALDLETPPFVRRLCEKCQIPLCSSCILGLQKHDPDSKFLDGSTIPMSLCNDHYYGHVNRFIVDAKVTWLECAASCMVWSTILIFYLEMPYGHLMNERMGGASARTQVKGNLFSFTLPWEDIEKCCHLACVHAEEPHKKI